MGCYEEREENKKPYDNKKNNKSNKHYEHNNDDLWILYKHILIESDLKKSKYDLKVFLISAESIPEFLKIIEESKILEYKNNSTENMMKIYEKQLIELFKGYKLETNMKIYNDFVTCKDIAGDNNEKANEFIIVDQKFLEITELEKENEDKYLLIKYIDNRQKIYFPKADLSLDFRYKRKGIFCFTNDDYDEREFKKQFNDEKEDNISFGSDQNNNKIKKKRLSKNMNENENNLNNESMSESQKELKFANNFDENKDKKKGVIHPN